MNYLVYGVVALIVLAGAPESHLTIRDHCHAR
jgi:hypothetical protein